MAGLALTAFFVFLGFPYDLLAERIGAAAGQQLDMRIRIGELGPHVGFFGPGLSAKEVLAASEGQPTIRVEELVLRPAWSLAWFQGMPAVYLDVTSDVGNGAGTLVVGERGGWTGDLEAVQVESLPLETLDALDLRGVLDAEVDLRGAGIDAGGGFVGQVAFRLREGSIQTQGLPMAVPFESLHGRLLFGQDQNLVVVENVQLAGPLIAGTIDGQVGQGASPGRAPLDIKLAFEVSDPSLEGMFASLGRRGADGRRHLEIRGTLNRPLVR